MTTGLWLTSRDKADYVSLEILVLLCLLKIKLCLSQAKHLLPLGFFINKLSFLHTFLTGEISTETIQDYNDYFGKIFLSKTIFI